ncbi:MAG: hypothetical protein A4S09_03725 [Proteobacteria bacterium SG_bin7]|nr:MAG: hypothetical protein A4S09_03725 [Proteobacteria bacterium SG_bin7]
MNKLIQNVLIVDDNPSDIAIAKHCAEKLGMNAVSANGGFEALELLGQYHFDIYVVDLQMPKMSGIDLLKRIKPIAEQSKGSVLVMSGRSRPTDIEQAVRVGAKDYIVKPIDLMILESKLISLANLHQKDWVEYSVEDMNDSTAELCLPAQIMSISEVGLTFHSSSALKAGQVVTLNAELLTKVGVPSVAVRVAEEIGDLNNIRTYKSFFIGLKEEHLRKIRLLCKNLWTTQMTKKNGVTV